MSKRERSTVDPHIAHCWFNSTPICAHRPSVPSAVLSSQTFLQVSNNLATKVTFFHCVFWRTTKNRECECKQPKQDKGNNQEGQPVFQQEDKANNRNSSIPIFSVTFSLCGSGFYVSVFHSNTHKPFQKYLVSLPFLSGVLSRGLLRAITSCIVSKKKRTVPLSGVFVGCSEKNVYMWTAVLCFFFLS